MRDAKIHIGSVALATISAGPVFVFATGSAIWTSGTDAFGVMPDTDVLTTYAGEGIAVAIAAAVLGSVLAIVPNLVGATVLTWLGRDNIGLRLPVMWGLVGGLVAGLPFMLADPDPATDAVAVGFAATGTVCALLCRYGVAWDLSPERLRGARTRPHERALSPRATPAIESG